MNINRPKPPDDISHISFVVREWAKLRAKVLRDEDVSIIVERIGAHIEKGKLNFSNGALKAGFDWEIDLAAAAELHAWNITWRDTIRSNNAKLAEWWKELGKRQYDLAEKMILSGINIIIAGHGTVAITCLNALVSSRGKEYQSGLAFAIFGAVIGLFMVVGGKIAYIEWLGSLSNTIKAKLTFHPRPIRLRALAKYTEKVTKAPARLTQWLIYGSIVWFAIYVFTALLLIMQAESPVAPQNGSVRTPYP